jgi:hypothetical protein
MPNSLDMALHTKADAVNEETFLPTILEEVDILDIPLR